MLPESYSGLGVSRRVFRAPAMACLAIFLAVLSLAAGQSPGRGFLQTSDQGFWHTAPAYPSFKDQDFVDIAAQRHAYLQDLEQGRLGLQRTLQHASAPSRYVRKGSGAGALPANTRGWVCLPLPLINHELSPTEANASEMFYHRQLGITHCMWPDGTMRVRDQGNYFVQPQSPRTHHSCQQSPNHPL